MRIVYLPANQAYAIMWEDLVLRIFNEKWEAIEQLKDWGIKC